jgi:hypothetical protein
MRWVLVASRSIWSAHELDTGPHVPIVGLIFTVIRGSVRRLGSSMGSSVYVVPSLPVSVVVRRSDVASSAAFVAASKPVRNVPLGHLPAGGGR